MLPVDSLAPDFTLPDQHGEPVSLTDFTGEWVLLWWYPKALTPGCTSCGQGFQRSIAAFDERACRILGVSFDAPERNLAFARQHRFTFPLLTATYELGRLYGTKRDDGEEWADVPRRISYLIDPDGVIRKAYRVLDPSQHPEQVLADLRDLRPVSRLRRVLGRSR